MGFFHKNVNLFLMIVIIISVVAYAGSTIYYQETFQNVTSESQYTKTRYSTCQAQLDNTMGKLTRTQEILNATESDIKKYDALYEDKTAELTTTKSTLDTTQADLAKYTSLYTQEKKKADDFSAEVSRLTGIKNQLTSEKNSLLLQVASLQDDVADLQDDVEDLQDQLDDCTGS